jgi:hypothetical protein
VSVTYLDALRTESRRNMERIDHITADEMRKSLQRHIPEHCRAPLLAYIEHGRPTGDFLKMILSGCSWFTAVTWADDTNREHLLRYAQFLLNDAPQECWGSPDKVRAWIARRGLYGQGVAA